MTNTQIAAFTWIKRNTGSKHEHQMLILFLKYIEAHLLSLQERKFLKVCAPGSHLKEEGEEKESSYYVEVKEREGLRSMEE